LILQSIYISVIEPYGKIHTNINLGNLEYSVGITALSDTAAYYGDDLPLSLWLTYWNDHASLVEHRERMTSPAQKALAEAALFQVLVKKDLTYSTISTIVNESLAKLLVERVKL
jgi:hypothetical protein